MRSFEGDFTSVAKVGLGAITGQIPPLTMEVVDCDAVVDHVVAGLLR